MEKIEIAFGLAVKNIEMIQDELDVDFYEAFIEQNANYLGALIAEMPEAQTAEIAENNNHLRSLNLSKQEWQKLFQFVMLKGSQVAPMQPNHAMTPDAIALIFQFVIEHLHSEQNLRMIELGSGMGNLAEGLLVNLQKEVDYVGLEVDDLLLDLSASMAEIIGTSAKFIQVDAVQAQQIEQADVLLSDLPVGFYPADTVVKQFEVANSSGHTFAHHLMIEQGFKYLKNGGFALFLAPEDLLTSPQGKLLKDWLSNHGSLTAVLTLPKSLFNADSKAIYILKKGPAAHATFAYPLSSLTDRESLQNFMAEFKKNVKL